MRASFWAQIGTMALPLGVTIIALAVALGAENPWFGVLMWIAISLVAVGFACIGAGWKLTVNKEALEKVEATERENSRRDEKQRREGEHQRYIATLDEVIRRLGGSPTAMRHRKDGAVGRARDDRELDKESKS